MEKAPVADIRAEDMLKQGMRLGVEYLAGNDAALDTLVAEDLGGDSVLHRQGVIQVFLRNIVIPRDENLETAERARQGIGRIVGPAADLNNTLDEIKMILEYYLKQKADLRQQLENALRQQLEKAVAQQTGQTETAFKIDPTRHPKFQEEWQRILSGLNEQYGAALEQHKAVLAQRLA